MGKILIVVAVVLVGAWLLFGRSRRDRVKGDGAASRPRAAVEPPSKMVACAHCGVHLPREDAVAGAAGVSYCSEAHRDAGPR